MEKGLLISQCPVEISGPSSCRYEHSIANCSTNQQRSLDTPQPHQNKMNLNFLQITDSISDQKARGKLQYFHHSVRVLA